MLTQMLNWNLRSISSTGMVLVVAATLLVLLTGSAGAAALPVVGPPFGACNTAGSGCLNATESVQVLANSCINFFNGNTPDVCGGVDSVAENAPLDASIFTIGGMGTTKDLIFMSPPPTQFMVVPGPLGSVNFDLVSTIASGQPACPMSPSGIISCSIGIFTLTQTDLNSGGAVCPGGSGTCGQVIVGFGFNANAYLNSIGTGFTPYVMNYSSQFNNETVADLINKAFTGTGPTGGISNSVSMTANPVTIPEPAGFVLIGAGLIGISLLVRRRASRT